MAQRSVTDTHPEELSRPFESDERGRHGHAIGNAERQEDCGVRNLRSPQCGRETAELSSLRGRVIAFGERAQ